MGTLPSYLCQLLLVVNANCLTVTVLNFIVECTHCYYNVYLLPFRVLLFSAVSAVFTVFAVVFFT